MPKKNREIGFTIEDKERLAVMEQVLLRVEGKLDKLPCQHSPPVCNREARIVSLEKTMGRWVVGLISIIVGTVVAAIGTFFTFVD